MRVFFILLGLTLLCGCATAPPAIEVRRANLEHSSEFDEKLAHKRAADYYRSGDYIRAYNEYQTLVLGAPDADDLASVFRLLEFTETALALAGAKDKFKRQARAGYAQLAALKMRDKNVKARITAGQILLSSMDENSELLEQDIINALENSPRDTRLWNALGKVRDQKSDWVGAIDAYVQALQFLHIQGRSTASVHNNIGMSLLRQGRNKEALVKFMNARRGTAGNQTYENNYRLVLILSGDLKQALGGLEDIYAAQLLNDGGVIEQGRGNISKARSLYVQAIALSPIYFKTAHLNLAGL